MSGYVPPSQRIDLRGAPSSMETAADGWRRKGALEPARPAPRVERKPRRLLAVAVPPEPEADPIPPVPPPAQRSPDRYILAFRNGATRTIAPGAFNKLVRGENVVGFWRVWRKRGAA